MRRNKKVVMGCLAAALIMLMAALGIIALADAAPEYTASASTNLGESIALKVTPLTSKPSAWAMAWRVGTTPVNTVSIGIQVQPTGTNVVNPRLTYYIKAVCGSNSKYIVRGDNVGVTLGSVFSNSTGSMSIDSHLQSLGVSTSQDQTVTYYIYAKLEAAGAVSVQTLIAEVQEQAFSTVTYDYGGLATTTIRPSYDSEIARLYRGSYIATGVAPPGQPTSYTQWSTTDYSKLGSSWVATAISRTDAPSNNVYYKYIVATQIIYSSVANGTVYWRGYTSCWRSDYASVTTAFRIYKWTGDSWTLVESVIPAPTPDQILTRTLSAGTYALCLGIQVETYDAGITYNAYIYTNDVQITYEAINWSLSWSWANQPLSLVAVPVARLMVTLSLLCFAGLILYAGRGSKISLAAAFAFVLLAVLFGLGVAYAAEPQTVAPMPVPEKWQAGETAIYLQSFPFPTVEYYNGTAVEKPAEVIGDLALSLAVFNATSDMPVLIKVDGQDTWQLRGEGFYSLQCSLSPGMHSIVIYCPIKIFEEAVFYVKPKPVTPLMPLEEFLRRLEQQRNEIVTRSLAAAAAGVPAGVWLKRKTKVRVDSVLLLPACLAGLGYWQMPNLYMLLPFAVTAALSYMLCPEHVKKHAVLESLRGKTGSVAKYALKFLKIDPDSGDVIVGSGIRYWRDGLINRARLELEDPVVKTLEYDGELMQCYIAKQVEHVDDKIKIVGDQATALTLDYGAEVIEALAEENSELKATVIFHDRLMPCRVIDGIKAVEEETRARDERMLSASEFVKRLKRRIKTEPTYQVKVNEVNGGNENQT